MTWSALPEHLNSPEEVEVSFPDDSKNGPIMRWFLKKTKAWFAFGPRATEWWARWREYPVVLLAVGGEGVWRGESSDGSYTDYITSKVLVPGWENKPGDHYVAERIYLSRIQYWKRWHVQLQWPLFFACHVTVRGRVTYFYVGAHRDADKVYWFPSAFLGGGWK